MLLFFRNETGFGGNNGLTDFKRIARLQHHQPRGMRVGLCVASALALIGATCWRSSSRKAAGAGC